MKPKTKSILETLRECENELCELRRITKGGTAKTSGLILKVQTLIGSLDGVRWHQDKP